VVVGVLLEKAGGEDDGEVVSGFGDELEADGEIFGRETARDGEGREAAEIANGAELIGEGKAGFEV